MIDLTLDSSYQAETCFKSTEKIFIKVLTFKVNLDFKFGFPGQRKNNVIETEFRC